MLASGLITALINLALFLIVVGVRYLLHHEGPAAFGLHLDRPGRRLFAAGLLVGVITFAIYPLVVVLLGHGALSLDPAQLGYTASL